MSGDFFSHNDQQPPIPVKQARDLQQRCRASLAMDEIKESRWYNTNYILEIESMLVNERYRTGSNARVRGSYIIRSLIPRKPQKKLGMFFGKKGFLPKHQYLKNQVHYHKKLQFLVLLDYLH